MADKRKTIKVRAKKDFISAVHGNISKGDVFNISGVYINSFIHNGLVEQIDAPDDVAEEAAPEEAKEETKGEAKIINLGGGWYNVQDADGNNISDKNLRKSAAEDLLASL